MILIPTILAKDIKATIELPDDVSDNMVDVILEKIVVIKNNRYTLIDQIPHNVSPDGQHVITLTHTLLSDIIYEELPLPLICYYQYSKKNGVNKNLIAFLISQIQQHPLYEYAVNNEKVVDETTDLEDLIEFDEDDTDTMDEESYVATEQILHNMMKIVL
jgi:hypothetical protein